MKVSGARAFFLFWAGQLVSLFGTSLSGFALGVWTFQQTNSITQYALIAVFVTVPGLLLATPAGALVDRWPRRRVLIGSDSLAAVLTLITMLLVQRGQLTIGYIYFVTVVQAILRAFQAPAAAAAIQSLVPRSQLGRANGLFSLSDAASAIIAPLVAGVVLVKVGLHGVLLIDLGTFLAAVVSLTLIVLPTPARLSAETPARSSLLQDIQTGWRFLSGAPGLSGLLVLSIITTNVFEAARVLLTPLILSFAAADVLGAVYAVASLGALLGSLVMAAWGGPRRRIHGVVGFGFLIGFSLLLGGWRESAVWIGAAAFVVMFGVPIANGCTSAIWLAKTPPALVGRVLGINRALGLALATAVFVLVGPLADHIFEPALAPSGALAGSIGTLIGVGPGRGLAFMLMLVGALPIGAGLWGFLNPRVRRLEITLLDYAGPEEAMTANQSPEPPTDRPQRRRRPAGRRIGRAVLVGLTLLILGLALTATAWLRAPFPTLEGALRLPGLSAPVEVYRDKWGTPHLYAQNQRDLLLAQGYTHAQERFWQMEMARRLAEGRLAEVLGPPAIDSDLFARNVGWNRVAAATLADYKANDPDTLAALQAYSDGVNAYLAEHGANVSINQRILGLTGRPTTIEAWRPLDSLAYAVYLSWFISGSGILDYAEYGIYGALGPELALAALPDYPAAGPVIAPDWSDAPTGASVGSPDVLADPGRVSLQLIGRPPVWGGPGRTGSNAWALSGQYTASGAPLLANDPHLEAQMPSIWYQIGLHAPGMDVVGYSLAGGPGVVIGRNPFIAWGLASSSIDVQDVYLEKMNPDNPNQYAYMGQWEDVTTLHEIIKVTGIPDIDLEVQLTRHGPIITEFQPQTPDVFAIRWEAYEHPNRLFRAILALNQATNYDEFRAALRYWDTAAGDFVYADAAGNIAYQLAASVPVRPPGGRLPRVGWSGAEEWEGWIAYEELPHVLNPASGYVTAANNAIAAAGPMAQGRWSSDDRAQRIVAWLGDKIAAGEKVEAADFAQLQGDNALWLASRYIPLLAQLPAPDARTRQAIALLQAWDGEADQDSAAAAIFEMFIYELTKATLSDQLDAGLLDVYLTSLFGAQMTMLRNLADAPGHPLWDDQSTSVVEQRDDMLARALKVALDGLEQRLGGDMQRWQWGQIHSVRFVSLPLGVSGIAPLEWLVNRGPYPVSGSQVTVNTEAWAGANPASVVILPSLRLVVDLSDPDAAQGIHTTGQSGHPLHPHYADLTPLWLRGELLPMPLSQARVEQVTVQRLTLTPP